MRNATASYARDRSSAATCCDTCRAPPRRKRDTEYEQAIGRAGRLGLSHREIAAAAQVSHATVRAILTRGSTIDNGRAAEEQPSDGEPGELAA